MVYLFIKGGSVLHHTDLTAAQEIDGVSTPDLTITDKEFEDAGSMARLIDGAIVIGKTNAEKLEDKQQEVRTKRNKLLAEVVDPEQKVLVWNDLTTDQQNAWAAYRKALLDIPEQEVFATDPDAVVWPEAPQD